MERNTKIIIGISVLTVAGISAYLILRKREKYNTDLALPETPDYKTSTVNTPKLKCIYKAERFPLKRCMTSKRIKLVQRFLNAFFHAGIKENGFFGDETEKALLKYLHRNTISLSDYQKMLLTLSATRKI